MADLPFKKSLWYFAIILIFLELIIYKEFIIGDYYFLFKDLGDDSYISAYPELYAKIEALKSGQIPGYNFHTALGVNKYPYWLEPIAISISYLFFKNGIASSFIWIQLLYTFFAGSIIFIFFRKNNIHAYPAAIGGILYAFSGYMIGCSTWYLLQFSNDIMLFAFFLLALHYFLQNKKVYLLPVSVAFISIAYTTTLLYFVFILVVIYLLINLDKINTLYEFAKQLLRLGLAGLCGMGLASFTLWSNLYQMLNSPRGSGMYPIVDQLKQTPIKMADSSELSTAMLRLFSNNLQSIAENFKGWNNYFEAPFLYCGLLVLLLIPQLFHFLSKRNRLVFGGILSFFILIFAVPYFRLAFWLFAGNYYRMIGQIVTIVLIYFATKALDEIIKQQKVYLRTLVFSFVVLLSLLFVLKDAISTDAASIVTFIVLFLVGYLAMLYSFGNKRFIVYFPLSILGFVCIEMILFATPTLNERKIVTTDDIKVGKGYRDITQKIVADIKKIDSSFFRLEKDYFSAQSRVISYNEALIQGFYGSAGYLSFHNSNYIRFLSSVGALYEKGELGSRFVKGIRDIPDAMRLCGVKYFISNQDNIESYLGNFELLNEQNGHSILKMKNHLPLGFTFSLYITENDFQKLKLADRRQLLTQAVVVDSSFSKQLGSLKRITMSDSLATSHTYFNLLSFNENLIKGNIELSQPEVLFFSIPMDKGWKIIDNGQEAKINIVFSGLMGIYLKAGNHNLELIFVDPYQRTGILISIVTLLLLLSYMSIIYLLDKRAKA